MTNEEATKLSRRTVRIRRVLHHAESLVYFDDVNGKDVDRVLEYLHENLPEKVASLIFKKCHLRKLTNFWVLASDRGEYKGMAEPKQLLAVFHLLAKYCNREDVRHDTGQISVSKPMD